MKEVTIKVYRYDPESGQPPRFETHKIPFLAGMSVLMALEELNERIPLTFRWSCHIGLCNICSMRVNGKPLLTCLEAMKEPVELTIEPVKGHPILRDLAVDPERREKRG